MLARGVACGAQLMKSNIMEESIMNNFDRNFLTTRGDCFVVAQGAPPRNDICDVEFFIKKFPG
jgi:hypothetical protein